MIVVNPLAVERPFGLVGHYYYFFIPDKLCASQLMIQANMCQDSFQRSDLSSFSVSCNALLV